MLFTIRGSYFNVFYSHISAFIRLHSPLPLYLDILRVAETRLVAFQSRHHRLLAVHFRPLGGSMVPFEPFLVAEKPVWVRPLRFAVGAIGQKKIHELRLPHRTA